MNINTWIMLGILILLAIIVWFLHGRAEVFQGLKEGIFTLKNVWILLILALGIAGLLKVIIPGEVISDYLGPDSGMRGILIGWGFGAVLPGAPYTILPLAATLLDSGAGIGAVMTMVLSASIGVAITRIPYEIAFIGWKFVVVRLVSCLIFPILGGLIANLFNQWVKFIPGQNF